MEKTNDAEISLLDKPIIRLGTKQSKKYRQNTEISLLDAPVGAVVDLVSWGNLSQEDIRKLTDVGIYLDLPLTVSSVTISGPVVVAISNVHVAIGRPVAKELKVLWNKEVEK